MALPGSNYKAIPLQKLWKNLRIQGIEKFSCCINIYIYIFELATNMKSYRAKYKFKR